jgi:thymidine kinase
MFAPTDIGWIEIICGSMFSGKTEELIRRIRRAEFARQRVQTFKPALDDRYDEVRIVSHNSISVHAQVVRSTEDILSLLHEETEVVAIDEGQFFDQDLPEICESLANDGKRVIVAGLDQDYLGRPFGPIPYLMAISEYVTKTLAICVLCGNPANRSDRFVEETATVDVGATEKYRALCRRCFAEERIASLTV